MPTTIALLWKYSDKKVINKEATCTQAMTSDYVK